MSTLRQLRNVWIHGFGNSAERAECRQDPRLCGTAGQCKHRHVGYGRGTNARENHFAGECW